MGWIEKGHTCLLPESAEENVLSQEWVCDECFRRWRAGWVKHSGTATDPGSVTKIGFVRVYE